MWSELQQRLAESKFAGQLNADVSATGTRLLDELAERNPDLADHLYRIAAEAGGHALWRGLLASEFLRHALLAETAFALSWLQAGCQLPDDADAALDALVAEHGSVSGLRRHRRQQMLVIGLRDIAGQSGLDETLGALSALADRCLCHALGVARRRMRERHGELRDEDGNSIALYAICMGKLGGRELNFSSDIDLIFAYDCDGESDGKRALLASEYGLREARAVIELIDAPTEEGRVFRVDTRLRPFGEAGPLAISLTSLEGYLQQHGRDWERYAFIKARFVGAASNLENELGKQVMRFRRDVLRPFVYRRYLDFGVLSSLRDMKQMIASEVARRDMREHLKLGPGGIREIEFIAQSWQLIRGGQVAALRTTSLRDALNAAAQAGCLSTSAVAELLDAYALLREVENRLQALADRQTHRLPDGAAGQDALVLAMHADDWSSLMTSLDEHRSRVTRHFGELLFNEDSDQEGESHLLWLDLPEQSLTDTLAGHGIEPAQAVAGELLEFRERLLRVPLERIARDRLDLFVDGFVQELEARDDAGVVAARVLQVASAVLRRSAYLSLLNEQPDALRRLVDLCAASGYLSRQIAEHPMLIDELLDSRMFSTPLQGDSLRDELAELMDERRPGDVEAAMQVLVRFARTVWFRIAVADCSNALPIMKVSDHLSEVAEVILEHTLTLAWDDITARAGYPQDCDAGRTHFSIVAYGKLGGLELGYGSDLDIVFLHDLPAGDTDGEKPIDHSVFVMRLAKRIVHFLSVQTGHGRLFEVDTRLRPSGRSGLLVSTLAAFRKYQQEDAWTWEHQALIRARAVAGDRDVGNEFEEVRRDVLRNSVNRETLRDEVLKMRNRMREELSRAGSGQFDIKQDAGGITDIEFLVQYLVLANADAAPALLESTDNIRQLDSLEAAGLLDAGTVRLLQDSYRSYRQRVHRLALDRQSQVVGDGEFAAERRAVQSAWREVFGDAAGG